MKSNRLPLVIFLALALALAALTAPALATALSAARAVKWTDSTFAWFPVEDNVKIYSGAFVMVNTSGYLIPGADTASCRFMGVADQTVDNTVTGHTQGGKTCRIRRRGIISTAASGLAQTSVGQPAYLTDDQTIALISTNHVWAGTIVKYTSASLCQLYLAETVTPSAAVGH